MASRGNRYFRPRLFPCLAFVCATLAALAILVDRTEESTRDVVGRVASRGGEIDAQTHQLSPVESLTGAAPTRSTVDRPTQPPPPQPKWPDGERGLPDASGLTLSQKVDRILRHESEYLVARDSGDQTAQVKAEYHLALECAVAVIRERGDAQYSLDVDDGVQRGFRLRDVPAGHVGIASDNAKYAISLSEFPAVALARDRYLSLRRSQAPVLPLTQEQSGLYAQAVEDAMASLGIHPDSSSKRRYK